MKNQSKYFLIKKLKRMEAEASLRDKREQQMLQQAEYFEKKARELRQKRLKSIRYSEKLWGFIYNLNDIINKHIKAA
jgi:hypothetical protein